MIPQVITATQFKNRAGQVYDEVAKRRGVKLIRRHKAVKHAIINADYLEDLLEASDPQYLKSIAKARKEVAEGKIYRHEEVFGEL